MRAKAILFDLFDTLLLIEQGELFYKPSLAELHQFLVKNGIDVSFVEFSRAYTEARERLYADAAENLGEPHFNLRVQRALQSLGYSFGPSDEIVVGATAAFCEEFTRYVRMERNVVQVLEQLHSEYRLGIVSNFAIPECVQKLLKKFGLERFFDVVVVSGAINKRKPSPEIFTKALASLGVEASETVFVGDTLDVDVLGAKNAGMKTVFVERRAQKGMGRARPDWTIKSLNELSASLGHW